MRFCDCGTKISSCDGRKLKRCAKCVRNAKKGQLKMLDLCSGLGGASEAMMKNPSWEVQRIENNHALNFVKNTTFMCVKKLATQIRKQQMIYVELVCSEIDLIWASPPCVEFSLAYSAPKPRAQREGIPFTPDLSVVEACKEIIDLIHPKYWVIENVRGAIKDLKPLLGNPRLIIGPYVLWGNFPLFDVLPADLKSKFEEDTWSSDPLRANKRALVPYKLSQALRQAIETQKTVWDY